MKKYLFLATIVPLLQINVLYGMDQYPKHFSWIDESKTVGGMAEPKTKADIQYLKNQNIGAIVTLTKHPLAPELKDPEISYVHIPVVSNTAPSSEQILQAIKTIQATISREKSVIFHCVVGVGRTGTMLACWLVKHENISAEQAINKIRKLRPGSIETKSQEQAVRDYAQSLITAQ